MRTIIGNAMVLENRDYKDADIKVLLSTDKNGHIYTVAPNARRSKKRFIGGLNNFSLIEFMAEKKGDFYVLNESTLLDENEHIFKSLEIFISASSIIEIALKLYTHNNPGETAFYRLKYAFEHLSEKKDLSIIFNFLRSALIDTGEIPEFQFCAVCQRRIEQKRFVFNYYRGGILCGDCLKKDNRGENISQILYTLMSSDDLEVYRFSDGVIKQGIFLLERYLRFRLNIFFKSFDFL